MTEQTSDNIYEIGNNAAVVLSASGGAFVEFGEINPIGGEVSPIKTVNTTKNGDVDYACWGKNNRLPIDRELLVMDNNIVPELMHAKRDMLLGNGMMLYKERFEKDSNDKFVRVVEEVEMSQKMIDWLEENEYEDFLELAAKELVLQGQFFAEFRHKAGGDCKSIELIECAYVRAERQRQREKTGRFDIQNWLVSGQWVSGGSKSTVEVISNYNKSAKYQAKYIRRYADKMFGGPYYYSPAYWGSRNWIQLANAIPIFHLSNLKNGYSLRYHVKIPKDYFIHSSKPLNQLSKTEREKVFKDAEARKQEFMRKLDGMLSGEKNAGKTLWSTYDVKRHLDQKYPGIIVEPITVDLKDESLLKLFDKSNDANISAQGILPSLSGIQTQGKLSSGSDIRNAFTFYIAAKTRVHRRNLFAAFNHVGKKNGWFQGQYQNCKFGARDIVLSTLDKEPTGISEGQNLN